MRWYGDPLYRGYPHLKHFGFDSQLKRAQHDAHNAPCVSTKSPHTGQTGG